MTHRDAVIERLADRNIRNRNHAEDVRDRLSTKQADRIAGPYIALSRESGTGGGEVAQEVGRKLGWDVLDREIIDRFVSETHTPRSLIESMDERHVNWMEDLFTSWMKAGDMSATAYVHRLQQMLTLAAEHGNVVIVGRGACCFLPQSGGISVRLVAPLSYRIDQVAKQQNLSRQAARQFVERSDREREAFVAERFHHPTDDPHHFDLVINMARISKEEAADLIVTVTESWMRRTAVSRPIQT